MISPAAPFAGRHWPPMGRSSRSGVNALGDAAGFDSVFLTAGEILSLSAPLTVPGSSTWAMMSIGFVRLSFAGYGRGLQAGRLHRLACEFGARCERRELRVGDLTRHWRHAAIGAREESIGRDIVERGADGVRHVLRRLDDVRRHVDAADQHVLAFEEPDQLDRYARIATFERDLVDMAPPTTRGGGLHIEPMLARRRFPIGVGLDAVAVTNVDGRRAF